MSDAKRVLERAIETWNAGDREGWAALYDENVEWEAPGGARISGIEDLKVKYFDALLEAAPDRASVVDSLFAEGDLVAEQDEIYGDAHRNVAEPGWRRDTGDWQELGLSVQRDLPRRELQDRLDPPVLRPARGAHSAWSNAGAQT
jgi:hypothetical protein